MERISGETDMHSDGGNVESHMHVRSGASRADAGGGFRDRAAGIADRARETAARLGEPLRHPGDLLRAARENPLTALGIAFSSGLILSAVGKRKKRHWVFDRARRQIRTIVVSAVAATLTHEIRSLIEDDEEGEDPIAPRSYGLDPEPALDRDVLPDEEEP